MTAAPCALNQRIFNSSMPSPVTAEVSTTGKYRVVRKLMLVYFKSRFSRFIDSVDSQYYITAKLQHLKQKGETSLKVNASPITRATSGLSFYQEVSRYSFIKAGSPRVYVPGKSTTSTVWLASFITPVLFSTVTPGQFATICLEPVNALNILVLPTLGFPRSAILIFFDSIASARFSTTKSISP